MNDKVQSPPIIDPFARDLVSDPYTSYAKFRETGSLCKGGPGLWVLTSYQTIRTALTSKALGQYAFYHKSKLNSSGPEASRANAVDAVNSFFANAVVSKDHSEHAEIRRALAHGLTLMLTEELRRLIAHEAQEIIYEASVLGEVDAVTQFSNKMTSTLLSQLLGITRTAALEASEKALDITPAFTPIASHPQLLKAGESIQWLRETIGQLVVRKSISNKLISSAVTAQKNYGWSTNYIVDNIVFLLFAGFETTANLISSGMALMAEYTTLQRQIKLCDDVNTAVQEFLRYDAPTQIIGRVVLNDFEIGDTVVPRGDAIIMLLASGNRDGNEFVAADELRLERSPNRHLSFGAGAHHCLGARFVRLLGVEFFSELSKSDLSFKLTGPIERRQSSTLRMYSSVPIFLS